MGNGTKNLCGTYTYYVVISSITTYSVHGDMKFMQEALWMPGLREIANPSIVYIEN